MNFKKQLKEAIENEFSGNSTIVAEDPGVAYMAKESSDPDNIYFMDKFTLYKVINSGLPYSIFEMVKTYTPFTEEEWADILDISTKSLLRYKKSNKRLKRTHSEKVMQIAEVCILADQVFDSQKQFKTWLNTPNFALGNEEPKNLLKDVYGLDLICTELTHIDQGIFV